MCSIIGCQWNDDVSAKIIKSLQRMEYRGYDSVGVATCHEDKIKLLKGVGKVSEVNQSKNLESLKGYTGIGHTRWATHGKVSEANAHPHLSSEFQNVAVVHNGIIENHQELKADLTCPFKSDTDTEVIANLLGYHYTRTGDAKVAMTQTINALKGNYAFLALFNDGTLAGARHHEPLVIGLGLFGVFLASDIIGFIEHTDNAIYLDNKEFVLVDPIGQGRMSIFDQMGKAVSHKTVKLSKELVDVYKDDYAHFTLKEINEQPDKITKSPASEELEDAAEIIRNASHVFITGSGTSYNAALVAKQIFTNYANITIEPIISSESRFTSHKFSDQSVIIAISQSGESSDVLETVNRAKEKGAKVVSIVNSLSSSLSRISDVEIGINCGPEIGVAATKSFTSQLAVIYKLMNRLQKRNDVDLCEISNGMKAILKYTDKIKALAKQLKQVQDVYILGRGIHCPIASEASLKLKELAYIHAEGMPGGELKHGPLALMDENVYTILLNPVDITYKEMLNSVNQIKSRGAKIIGISNLYCPAYDHWLEIPEIDDLYYPLLEILPIQLLSYYLALEKNNDPDYPRNLAKCCTTK